MNMFENSNHYLTRTICAFAFVISFVLTGSGQVNNAAMIFDPSESGDINTSQQQFLPVSNLSAYASGDITVETWVKVPDASVYNVQIFNSGSAVTPELGGYNFFINAANLPALYIYSSNGNVVLLANTPVPYDDTWHHLAFTINETAGSVSLFIDGELDVTASLPLGYVNQNQNPSLNIGLNFNKEVHMDEIRIWSTAKTQAAIEAGMYECPDDSDPQLEMRFTGEDYTFDQANGTILFHDMSANANDTYLNQPDGDILVQGAVCCGYTPNVEREGHSLIVFHADETYQWFDCETDQPIAGADGQIFTPTVSGDYYCELSLGNCPLVVSECASVDLSGPSPYVGAQDFNQTDQKITISNTDLPNGGAGPITQFTIEAWIRPSKTSWGRIVGKYSGSGVYEGLIVLDTYHPVDNGINLRFATANANSAMPVFAQNVLTLQTWQHVAVTFNSGEVRIYVNGELVGSGTVPLTSIAASADNWVIGADNIFGNSAWFGGYISDFRMWNTARSQSEISTNMHSCLDGTEAGLVVLYDFNDVSGTTLFDKTPAGNNALIQGASVLTVIDGPVMCTDATNVGVGSIEDGPLDAVQVVPNPTRGDMTVRLSENQTAVSITVMDLAGRVVSTAKRANTSTVQLSIDGPSGVYMVQIEGDDQVKRVQRVVKY